MIARFLVAMVLVGGLGAHAQTKAADEACRALVLKAIKDDAKKQGLTKEFNVKLFRKGTALTKNKIIEYKAGNFIVPDGRIPNSWASVSVRLKGKACEIVRKTVNVGRP